VKYLFLGLIIYWVVKRISRISYVVRQNDSQKQETTVNNSQKPTKKNDKHGGQYVDYEEVE
jgi:hypothetical protein